MSSLVSEKRSSQLGGSSMGDETVTFPTRTIEDSLMPGNGRAAREVM
jgi:hypothetical protein